MHQAEKRRPIRAAVLMLLWMAAGCWIPSAGFGAESLIDAAGQRQTGDLPEITQRRVIRVLVNYSRTNFFYDNGRPHGFEYEMLMAYQKQLNEGFKQHREGIRMLFIPVRFDQLIPGLVNGKGDIAAAGLTVTRERAQRVAFTTPYLTDIDEVVVTSKSVTGINRLADLLYRTVTVRKDSSYVSHLEAFNRQNGGRGAKKFFVREVNPFLVTEDILEMVNAGIVDITVADAHIAQAWSRVLPDIVVRDDLVIHRGGTIAWAVRKDSPKLRESLNAFIKRHKKGTLLGNIVYDRYYQNPRWIRNAMDGKAMKRLQALMPLFEKYGRQYDFDPIMLAAMAFQESGFNNAKKSARGAVGVMQILPSTAADKNIGIKNPGALENNIHAGTKYLAFIRSRYFSAPDIAPTDRVFFSLAAYNAGPARVNQLRRTAAAKGLDPNRWFFNVEVVAARDIGRETVTYVANIAKYYVTYRMQFDMQKARQEAKEAVFDQGGR